MSMIPRNLAALFAIAIMFGIGGGAPAQEQPGPRAEGAAPIKDEPAAPEGKAEDAERPEPRTELATFGGGCFWCTEAVFERIPGVKSVVSGYAGGNVPNPTYEMVSSGLTGHAEVIQVAFDPEKVSFEQLLKVFFASHDPTTPNRQGPDHGPQYRSIILTSTDEQQQTAQAAIRTLNASPGRRAMVVTEVVPLTTFYPAEGYHQNYYRKNPGAPYSRIYIAPKLNKLKQKAK